MKSGIIVLVLALAAAAPAGAVSLEALERSVAQQGIDQACSVVRYCMDDGSVGAATGEQWNIKNYRVSFPKDFRAHIIGERDMTHGDWLTGTGIDLLWLKRKDEQDPIAYLLGKQMFDLNREWKGALGASIGINTGQAGETIARAMGVIAPDQSKRIKWLRNAANWVSLELGGGYRFAGVPKDQSKLYWSAGGKVRVPIEKLWNKND